MGEIISEVPVVELKPVELIVPVFVDESIKGKYTTSDLVLKDASVEKIESSKVVLSPDTLAICQLLETMINVMRSKN
jgi:hypothetical protein